MKDTLILNNRNVLRANTRNSVSEEVVRIQNL